MELGCELWETEARAGAEVSLVLGVAMVAKLSWDVSYYLPPNRWIKIT